MCTGLVGLAVLDADVLGVPGELEDVEPEDVPLVTLAPEDGFPLLEEEQAEAVNAAATTRVASAHSGRARGNECGVFTPSRYATQLRMPAEGDLLTVRKPAQAGSVALSSTSRRRWLIT